jgi:S-formylglutathione hydrolase FrmB
VALLVLEVSSEALRGNPLGDPHVRPLHVVVPDDLAEGERVPCIWYLSGYASVSRGMLAHDPWQEGIEERLVRLRREGKLGKVIVALPDCFTKLGGCQYLGSTAVGDYATYLLRELRAEIEARFSISGHAICGKSSGGYGAIVHAMKHPDLFCGVACHSGDMGFRLAYTGEIASLMNAVHEHAGLERFVAAFERTQKKKDGRWLGPISALALASVYSPDPSRPLGIALPFDLDKGEIDEAVFTRWLAQDPVVMIEQKAHRDALSSMRLVFVDCGRRDEYHLQWGARAFHRTMEAHGVPHLYEEFDDGHRSTSYRLDESLPRLARAAAVTLS